MRPAVWSTLASAALVGGLALGLSGAAAETQRQSLRLPWKEAGLTERQAAAHLLNRFAFGPRPGEVDQVVAMGLGRWFEHQLAAGIPDPGLEARLRELPAMTMPETDMVRVYRNPGQILAEAQKVGVITKDELAAAKEDKKLVRLYEQQAAGDMAATPAVLGAGGAGAAAGGAGAAADDGNPALRPEVRARLLDFVRQRGFRPERQLQEQLLAQKILRAVESQNQLQEVMTDFWFNHFNVSSTNGQARPYLLAYERDAIRPAALGTVRDLLEATARHPAMLYYLNNAESTASPDAPTLLGDEMQTMQAQRQAYRRYGVAGPPPNMPGQAKNRGLNENYARELMELHTLGVDGGYTQKDVVEVARAFTGWTVLPSGPAREAAEKRLEKARLRGGLGFHEDGDFLFRADMHDDGPKLILGYHLPPGRGIEDGETVLDLLSSHQATARHLSTQLAVRFVSDNPPRALVDRLVATYDRSGGDVREILRTLVQSPELWSRDAVAAKVKSPFELAVSAVRVSGAEIDNPRQLLNWVSRMGQPLYAYQAPTGYPDRGDSWVNTGSLLNRMNFGLQLASQRIAGVAIDLPGLHEGREPESREEALRTYAALLLPGRDLESTMKLLTPLLTDPALVHRVDAAAPPAARAPDDGMAASGGGAAASGGRKASAGAAAPNGVALAADARRARPQQHPPTPLEQAVGLILGSPEFQRR
jgi:uncharacterized protein (DUF1800 family)